MITRDADRGWIHDISGNQLVLYMSKDDEENFLHFLHSTARVAVHPAFSSSADFETIQYFPDATETEETRRFWLENLQLAIPLVTSFDAARGVYVMDEVQSPVIEFVRSLDRGSFILPGRLRSEPNYYDSIKQDLIPKPAEFRKWVDSVRGWIRKSYTHLEWLIYAGPGAIKVRDAGGILH